MSHFLLSVMPLNLLTARIFSLFSVVLLISCGGGEKKTPPSESVDTSSSYTPAQQGSAYDPSKIDATAPVMDIKLEAVGNSMDVMSFSVQEIRVKAGTTVKLGFNNTASDQAMKHNFFIVQNGTMEDVAMKSLSAGPDKNYIPDDKTNILYTSPLLEPGESETLTFAAPPVGTYQFVCTYPGHWQKMNGKFIVE